MLKPMLVNSRTRDRLYEAARACLFGRPWRSYRLMRAVVAAFYPEIPRSVENKVCPFCGKRVALRRALYVHARVHSGEIDKIAHDCADKYVELIKMIKPLPRHRYYVKGICMFFSSFRELSEYLIKNPESVKKALGGCI
jgi:hypothetical protein